MTVYDARRSRNGLSRFILLGMVSIPMSACLDAATNGDALADTNHVERVATRKHAKEGEGRFVPTSDAVGSVNAGTAGALGNDGPVSDRPSDSEAAADQPEHQQQLERLQDERLTPPMSPGNELAPSWPEFLASFPVSEESGGNTTYVLGGDIAMAEPSMRLLYQARYGTELDKAAVIKLSQTAACNTSNYDRWSPLDQLDITYCFDNQWGDLKPRAVADMAEAAAQWMSAANVKFRYVPASDGVSCTGSAIDLEITPRCPAAPATCGGIAPFPSSASASTTQMGWGFSDVEGSGYTFLGGWTHELGHTLGLFHEHVRPECAFDDGSGEYQPSGSEKWCALSSYDANSAMHYAGLSEFCLSKSKGQLTSKDRQAIASLYGDPTSGVIAALPSAWMAGAGII
jgi:hypothetical protein